MSTQHGWMLLAALALGAPSASMAASQPRKLEIAVTEQGFEPARVEAAAGEPLELVVTRKTDDTCAKQIVVPEAGLRADLPLNHPMTLRFTPKHSGELRYTCGLGMLSGVIHVGSVGTPPHATTAPAGPGGSHPMGGGMMSGGMMGDGQGGGMGCCGGMMGGTMPEMSAIHRLLANHQDIQRSVEDVADGVVTTTTSPDPALASVIRQHVAQMKERIETGAAIRQGDPLFREIFANHQHIHMQIEDVPGGVRVKETADDPRVVPLVRQHARRAVSEFVAQGMPRAMRPTPLPPGYAPQAGAASQVSEMGCGCMSDSGGGP